MSGSVELEIWEVMMDWEYSQNGGSKVCTQNVGGETYSVMGILDGILLGLCWVDFDISNVKTVRFSYYS